MNIFDNLQAKAHDVVTQTMGYDAVWHAEGGDVTGRVLFNDPSKKTKLAGFDYEPASWSMEYKEGVFPNLKEIVDDAGYAQRVTINGTDYLVRQVTKEYDGKTYNAVLEPKTS